jgi:ATP-dependent protease ClpP protease subunit
MSRGDKATNDGASQDNTSNSILSTKRSILLSGEVNEACEKRVTESLERFNKENKHKKILLFINSRGGDYDSCMRIVEAIRASVAPVHGVVIWGACSAAFYILQVCKKRIAYSKKAVLMCHAPTLADVRADQTDRDIVIKKTEKAHRKFLRLVAERSYGKISFKKMCTLSRNEENISAYVARRLGLLDLVCRKRKKNK